MNFPRLFILALLGLLLAALLSCSTTQVGSRYPAGGGILTDTNGQPVRVFTNGVPQ